MSYTNKPVIKFCSIFLKISVKTFIALHIAELENETSSTYFVTLILLHFTYVYFPNSVFIFSHV